MKRKKYSLGIKNDLNRSPPFLLKQAQERLPKEGLNTKPFVKGLTENFNLLIISSKRSSQSRGAGWLLCNLPFLCYDRKDFSIFSHFCQSASCMGQFALLLSTQKHSSCALFFFSVSKNETTLVPIRPSQVILFFPSFM